MRSIVRDQWLKGIPARLPAWSLLLGLFLLICGAKLWLINGFGNPTPFWDEWDAEAGIIKGYIEGTLSPGIFFEGSNEHRIAFTRLLCLGLFRANHQWDPILLMVAQAPLHAAAIVFYVSKAGQSMGNLGKAALAGFAALVTVVPFGFYNTLWGFQSQFYFMMLFGMIAIWLCWRNEALTARWWWGVVIGFAGLFTMAGGVFSLVAVTAFLAARLIFERGKEFKRQLLGIGILGAIAAFGVITTPHPAVTERFEAASFKAFFWALTGILSWPCNAHWACVIIQAPLILLALLCVLRRVPFRDGRWFPILVGASCWIQALATAYRRCEAWAAERYHDSWCMLLIVLCSCLYFLPRVLGERGRWLIYPIAAAWLSACLYGAMDYGVNQLPRQIMDTHSAALEMENNVRQYLATGKEDWLKGQIPYPRQDLLERTLSSNTVRSVLPSNLLDRNPPLTPAGEKPGGGGFVKDNYSNGLPALNKSFFASYAKDGIETKSAISLEFKAPPGTREVEMQVAGQPNAKGIGLKIETRHGVSYRVAPFVDPGDKWETISVRLDPRSDYFKISAKNQSDNAWLAFSLPTVSTGGFPGRWARSLASGSFYFIDIGLVLMALGVIGGMRTD